MIVNILYVLLAIIMLGIIITAHEFGHYIMGRLCGIGIVEFAVGMGPRIFGWERKGIKYSLRAIPLGGFCSFVGEDEKNEDPRAMNNQPVWKRFLTVVSGPLMNFILAFVVCAIMLNAFFIGGTYPIINQAVEGMPVSEAGILEGDRIISMNGVSISNDTNGVNMLIETLGKSDPSQPIEMTVLRGDEELDFSFLPRQITDANGNSSWQIGIIFESRTYTFGESFREAGSYMVETTGMMLDSLKNLIFKGEGLEDTAGPVGIIALVSQRARDGMYMVLWLMFIISLNLGIMNLLPIPALDGCRLVFLIIEAIRRKPVPPEKEGLVHGIGFLLLLVLFVVLTYNDIVRQFNGGFNF